MIFEISIESVEYIGMEANRVVRLRMLVFALLGLAQGIEKCKEAYWNNHVFFRKTSAIFHRTPDGWSVMEPEGNVCFISIQISAESAEQGETVLNRKRVVMTSI